MGYKYSNIVFDAYIRYNNNSLGISWGVFKNFIKFAKMGKLDIIAFTVLLQLKDLRASQ